MRGKAKIVKQVVCRVVDHPRVCGEKYRLPCPLCAASWITPAYAGKSFFGSHIDVCEWDHPRVCGEKTKKIP